MGFVQKFKEKFPDKVTPESTIVYHGSKGKISDFSERHITQKGDEIPGIYFYSTENDARKHGGPYVSKVSLTLNRSISLLGPPKRGDITWMATHAPDKEEALKKFEDNPRNAMFQAIDFILDGGTASACFQRMWELFYKDNNVEFVKNLRKNGYDGIVLKQSEDLFHYIVFNPKSIQILKS